MISSFSLEGKSILITGASSGIGRQLCISVAASGAHVTLTGRDEERLKETLSAMEGTDHKMIVADLTKKENLKSFITGEGYDGVVFNAGIVEYLPVKFLSEDKIKKIFDSNFSSAAVLCQLLLKNKLVKREGSLVFISSISSRLGVPGTALYAASKAALGAFSRVVASEVASLGIRSNSVSPGIIITPMTEIAKDVASNDRLNEAVKQYPLGYGTTTDVAGPVIFLLSKASRWITGSDILLDGGFTLN